MDALLVIDMQEDLLLGDEKHDLSAVVARINRLAARVRERRGTVVFIQHDGSTDDGFVPFTPGWRILGSLDVEHDDLTVRKTRNNAFFRTTLEATLKKLGAERLLIAGWATDFCVDATVRSAVALEFDIVVVADAHTLSDRPHLSADKVIEHHHWVWTNLIAATPVRLANEADL